LVRGLEAVKNGFFPVVPLCIITWLARALAAVKTAYKPGYGISQEKENTLAFRNILQGSVMIMQKDLIAGHVPMGPQYRLDCRAARLANVQKMHMASPE
jgi:hypothetical protein